MTETRASPGHLVSILSLVAAFAICFAAARLGSMATTPNLPWYDTLAKPAFNPPNWAFPVAWTILFAMMAVSLWRVVMRPLERVPRGIALGVFAVQLALNIAWSSAFFGARDPGLGLLVIMALMAAITATILIFRPIDRLAAWLLVPYLAWVGFASLLNLSIWLMNGR